MQKLFKSDRLLPFMFGKTSLEIFIQDVMEPTLILKYSFEIITCQRVKLSRLQEVRFMQQSGIFFIGLLTFVAVYRGKYMCNCVLDFCRHNVREKFP